MGSYQAALLLQMRGASSNTKQIFLLMILMVGKKKGGGVIPQCTLWLSEALKKTADNARYRFLYTLRP